MRSKRRTKRRTRYFPSLRSRRFDVIGATKNGLRKGNALSFLRSFFVVVCQRATSPFTLSFPFFLGLPVYIPLALTVMLLVLVAQGVVCAESCGIYMVATARGFWNSLNFSWQFEISLTKWINNFTNYSSAAASSSGHRFSQVEARDWWWTARDHGKGTDLPAFLCVHIFIERETFG